ncbi:MAG: hypothetical protein AAF502_03925 [Bacteroidota bacterium]
MNSRRPLLHAGWLGIATIAFSFYLNSVFPTFAGEMQPGFTNPVLAFEFVENVDEVKALFSFDTAEELQLFRSKMDHGNRLDFIFMVIYNGFLFFLGWLLFKHSGRKPFFYILPLALVALAGDILETLQLLNISSRIDEDSLATPVLLLKWFTWLKWGALALIMHVFGLWLVKGARWMKILSTIAFAVPILGFIALFRPGLMNEFFALGIGLMFLGLTLTAFFYKDKEAVHPT